ncbi:GntR family transcriptional regulator [Falsihalocynthiibacter sp. SS001]|uniref:GntR family transcriptional regulator n=1 Tax=Falsihalocynthiibacter sp. SS001 TaxID=3349698 RepID=UPI0036D27E13
MCADIPKPQEPLIEGMSARDRVDRLHDEIRSRITLLDYPPGAKLSETELAEEFGVSRTPLRRVLARLEDEGLLTSVHGVGTFVTVVDYEELAQVYRIRKELILMQTSLDVVPPTPELIDRVREIQQRASAIKESPTMRAFALLDRDMFLTLLDLTSNGPLRNICTRLYFWTARIWLEQVTSSEIDLSQEIDIYANEVRDILAALEAGDLDAVGHLRRSHISLSFARMRK